MPVDPQVGIALCEGGLARQPVGQRDTLFVAPEPGSQVELPCGRHTFGSYRSEKRESTRYSGFWVGSGFRGFEVPAEVVGNAVALLPETFQQHAPRVGDSATVQHDLCRSGRRPLDPGLRVRTQERYFRPNLFL
jgi:hypothetical protein